MRQDERKGAWTLLIAVLVFGALVWGIGGRQFREDRMKADENNGIEMNVIANPADSATIANKEASKKKKDSSKKGDKSSKTSTEKKSSTSVSTSRDILSDTIKNSKP